jgi:hypothetical protein
MKNLYNCEGKLELCAILVFVIKVKTLFTVCYRLPDKHISEESWTQFFNQSAGKYLIVGDFNARHPLRGNQGACSEGRKLFNAIENSELSILISSQMTYRSKHYNMETAIDLAFVDYELLFLYKWEVVKDSWRRYHYPINIILNRRADYRIQHCICMPCTRWFKYDRDWFVCKQAAQVPVIFEPPCICTKKTDWDCVIMHWERRSEDTRNVVVDQNLDVQTKYTTVVSIIMEGVLDGSPRNQGATTTQVNKSRKSASFWDEECNWLIRRRKAALFKLKEFPTGENFLSYKKEEAKAKSRLRKIKKFYNSVNTQSNLTFGTKLANLRIRGIVGCNQMNTKMRKL